MEKKTRLDLILVEKGLVETREKARAMIMAGLVMVDQVKVEKPGRPTLRSSEITLAGPPHPYVSRGGLKLKAALDFFSVDVKGLTVLDVGASTGGFTDCLLQRGAEKVVAVDVGYGQFHWRLRRDPRVMLLEKTNIRYLEPQDLSVGVHGAVVDVSFISLKTVFSPLSRLLPKEAFVIALVKPQFEVGKGQVGKGGVVRDPLLHEQVMEELSGFFERSGWTLMGQMDSPVLGPKGNKEFLVYLRR